MAGNVSEWTLTQYQEGSFAFYHDLNPSYRRDYDYNSGEDRTRNRKVVKGGSWSDMAYFLQTGTRSWEYANEPRSFIDSVVLPVYWAKELNRYHQNKKIFLT